MLLRPFFYSGQHEYEQTKPLSCEFDAGARPTGWVRSCAPLRNLAMRQIPIPPTLVVRRGRRRKTPSIIPVPTTVRIWAGGKHGRGGKHGGSGKSRVWTIVLIVAAIVLAVSLGVLALLAMAIGMARRSTTTFPRHRAWRKRKRRSPI